MKRLMTAVLILFAFVMAPHVHAQGTKGPAGPGAQGADKQTEAAQPDALSGKFGTPRRESGEEPPADTQRDAPPARPDEAKSQNGERDPSNPDMPRAGSQVDEQGEPAQRPDPSR